MTENGRKQDVLFLYGTYLSSVLSAAVTQTPAAVPSFSINWKTLYALSQRHNCANIVYAALKGLPLPKETLLPFYEQYKLSAVREAKQAYCAQSVFAQFEKEQIAYVPLKGIVIKTYYPVPFWRSSVDIDLYIKKEDRLRAKAAMLSLDFEEIPGDTYHDIYHKEPIYNFELHHALTDPADRRAAYFENFFARSAAEKEGAAGRRFSKEDFYIYTLFHLYKHFVKGGCGIRLFLDIYLMNRKESYAQAYLDYALAQIGLLKFHHTVTTLTQMLFDGAAWTEPYKKLAGYIFASGTYGESLWFTMTVMDKGTRSFPYKKFKFFMQSWFLGPAAMEQKYPILKKLPFLLPVFWAHKGFYTLFFNRGAIQKQTDHLKNYNHAALQYLQEIRSIAGVGDD